MSDLLETIAFHAKARPEAPAVITSDAILTYGALWDGLLGWLMRDPRFEPGQLELVAPCVADTPTKLRVRLPSTTAPRAGAAGATDPKAKEMVVEVRRLDKSGDAPIRVEVPKRAAGSTSAVDIALPPLAAGGYTARLKLGAGPTTRRDFACESGGDEWADSRPDRDRMAYPRHERVRCSEKWMLPEGRCRE